MNFHGCVETSLIGITDLAPSVGKLAKPLEGIIGAVGSVEHSVML